MRLCGLRKRPTSSRRPSAITPRLVCVAPRSPRTREAQEVLRSDRRDGARPGKLRLWPLRGIGQGLKGFLKTVQRPSPLGALLCSSLPDLVELLPGALCPLESLLIVTHAASLAGPALQLRCAGAVLRRVRARALHTSPCSNPFRSLRGAALVFPCFDRGSCLGDCCLFQVDGLGRGLLVDKTRTFISAIRRHSLEVVSTASRKVRSQEALPVDVLACRGVICAITSGRRRGRPRGTGVAVVARDGFLRAR